MALYVTNVAGTASCIEPDVITAMSNKQHIPRGVSPLPRYTEPPFPRDQYPAIRIRPRVFQPAPEEPCERDFRGGRDQCSMNLHCRAARTLDVIQARDFTNLFY